MQLVGTVQTGNLQAVVYDLEVGVASRSYMLLAFMCVVYIHYTANADVCLQCPWCRGGGATECLRSAVCKVGHELTFQSTPSDSLTHNTWILFAI